MSEMARSIRPRNDTVPEFARVSDDVPGPTKPEGPDPLPKPVRSVRLVGATKRLFEALWSWFWVLLDECLVSRRVPSDEPGWVAQAQSPLGRRVHCNLVRKGVLRGHKVGKRVLVRHEDLDRYIESHAAAAAAVPAQPEAEVDEIAQALTKRGFVTKESKR